MSAFYPQPAEQLPPVAVSVVIPIFNMAQYLRCCLDSVCGQTLRDIEIICVNDASPDNALEIIHEYMRQDDRVTLIDFPENQGTSKARNAGMQAARGEYLAFVDSDDTVDLDFLHLLYREACNNTDVEMVKGNFRIFERKQNKLLGITNNDKVRDSKFNFTCFWTAIYKREFLETFKNMVFVRKAVICARKIVFADDAFYNYTPSGIGNNMSMWKIKDNLELHHMIVDYANQAEVEQQRYLILFNACFNALCLLDTQEVQGNQAAFEMIMESLIQLYAKCRYPEAFLATVDRRSAYKLLLTGDFDALMAYLKKPVRARIAADLRLRVSKANGLDAGMKSHIPVISIIIPVWNTEPYLRRCLDSVVNQTLHDIMNFLIT
jgi:glycosyltransferase involved in cell wall biosynthesis